MIVWRFKGIRIAKINKAVNQNPEYDIDKKFTDKLKLNIQNGDLTITDITAEHAGIYQLEIIGQKRTTKGFSVSEYHIISWLTSSV